jgi:predicted nucleic acid-binding protein
MPSKQWHSLMMQGLAVNLGVTISLSAARISIQFRLPMADSIMLATAPDYNATLWTQDADFKVIPGVRYIAKK